MTKKNWKNLTGLAFLIVMAIVLPFFVVGFRDWFMMIFQQPMYERDELTLTAFAGGFIGLVTWCTILIAGFNFIDSKFNA